MSVGTVGRTGRGVLVAERECSEGVGGVVKSSERHRWKRETLTSVTVDEPPQPAALFDSEPRSPQTIPPSFYLSFHFLLIFLPKQITAYFLF